jgi:hypothetical protein
VTKPAKLTAQFNSARPYVELQNRSKKCGPLLRIQSEVAKQQLCAERDSLLEREVQSSEKREALELRAKEGEECKRLLEEICGKKTDLEDEKIPCSKLSTSYYLVYNYFQSYSYIGLLSSRRSRLID